MDDGGVFLDHNVLYKKISGQHTVVGEGGESRRGKLMILMTHTHAHTRTNTHKHALTRHAMCSMWREDVDQFTPPDPPPSRTQQTRPTAHTGTKHTTAKGGLEDQTDRSTPALLRSGSTFKITIMISIISITSDAPGMALSEPQIQVLICMSIIYTSDASAMSCPHEGSHGVYVGGRERLLYGSGYPFVLTCRHAGGSRVCM